MGKLLLISIKEKYVNEILSGNKTIELRKASPRAEIGDTVIIYTTKPIKAITAIANIKKIISCTPNEMWSKNNKKLGISKIEFEAYYNKSSKAIGIELTNVTKLDEEILLSAIKLLNPQFSPPQTFKYLNKFATLKDFKTLNFNRLKN